MPPNPPRNAGAGALKAATAPSSQAAPTLSASAPPGNRKKQKKRQNQAAKKAAEQPAEVVSPTTGMAENGPGGIAPHGHGQGNALRFDVADDEHYESREGEIFYSDEESHA